MIPFEMIDEDLRIARRRARRRDELAKRRTAIAGLVREAQRRLNAIAVRDQEAVVAQEARLQAYTMALDTVERELAELGPAEELYEELLVREERRLIESADPRGSELLEIGRLLAELDVELPASVRARESGLALLRRAADQDALADFAQQVAALGMTAPDPRTPGAVDILVDRLEERCRKLEHLRDKLRTRRERLLHTHRRA
ncbi:hypothetical protein C1J01_16940 [Nonomuraea aridisoli]|uniref:Uncharacterized protein n=2 Tax=Nonomuraea aridisoli TaxID=2070368 RepID=A0A2W2EMN6_9ACTN|nr:hypothetical protein C1J01_16940 [Nonomuraea aridisoli]